MLDSKILEIFMDVAKFCVEDKIAETNGEFKCSKCKAVFNKKDNKMFDRHNVLCVAYTKWKSDTELLDSVKEIERWLCTMDSGRYSHVINDRYRKLTRYIISSERTDLMAYLENKLFKFYAEELLEIRCDKMVEVIIKISGSLRLYLRRSIYIKYCAKYNLPRIFELLCNRIRENISDKLDIFENVTTEYGDKVSYMMLCEVLWQGNTDFYEECKKICKVDDSYDLIKEHSRVCLSYAKSCNGYAKMYSHLSAKIMNFEKMYSECLSERMCKDVLGIVMSYT